MRKVEKQNVSFSVPKEKLQRFDAAWYALKERSRSAALESAMDSYIKEAQEKP